MESFDFRTRLFESSLARPSSRDRQCNGTHFVNHASESQVMDRFDLPGLWYLGTDAFLRPEGPSVHPARALRPWKKGSMIELRPEGPAVRCSQGTVDPLGLKRLLSGSRFSADGPWLEERMALQAVRICLAHSTEVSVSPRAPTRQRTSHHTSSKIKVSAIDRQGAEPACNRSAAWNHRGSRSLTVAAR